jgi:hypothetical protein
VVVTFGVANFEFDGHLRIEARNIAGLEIRGCIENQAIGAGGERAAGEKLAAAAVGVGDAAAEFFPVALRLFHLEEKRNASGRAAERCIKDVCSDVAHDGWLTGGSRSPGSRGGRR